jgi:C-terminal processing protease CtpA/Prc
MNFKTTGTILGLSILLGATPALAQDNDAEQARERAELKAAYEDAVEAARHERQLALESVERARTDMLRATEENARLAEAQSSAQAEQLAERERALEAREAETAAMREELSRAHESLRQASREVAQVHRELDRSHRVVAPSHSWLNLGDRAVIGVVLGDSTENGVKVLGVSPDGPSDRAGLEQGDIIISMMGKPLADGESADSKAVLTEVMEDVSVGDEISITVDRAGDELTYTVTADKREPFAWQSIVRLPSVPPAPGLPDTRMLLERIEVPEIDEKALIEQVERIREDLDHTRIIIQADRNMSFGDAPEAWEYRYETLSEIGDEALREANVWFGLPATRGLKLAEIDAGLGEYFETDRGVLVLKAKDDNNLQLQSGDVILQVGGKMVDKPSDVMRALREWEPGTNIEIDIKRERKEKTLDVVLPEKMLGFDFVPFTDDLHINIHTSED